MNPYKMAKKAFAELPLDKEITSKELLTLTHPKLINNPDYRKGFSSFLCQMVKRGLAERKGRRGAFQLYIRSDGTGTVCEPTTTDISQVSFGKLDLANSFLALIADLKQQVISLRGELNEEKATLKEQIEKNRQLEELLRQSQEKILALNQNGNNTFKLADLQAVRDRLPAV